MVEVPSAARQHPRSHLLVVAYQSFCHVSFDLDELGIFELTKLDTLARLADRIAHLFLPFKRPTRVESVCRFLTHVISVE